MNRSNVRWVFGLNKQRFSLCTAIPNISIEHCTLLRRKGELGDILEAGTERQSRFAGLVGENRFIYREYQPQSTYWGIYRICCLTENGASFHLYWLYKSQQTLGNRFSTFIAIMSQTFLIYFFKESIYVFFFFEEGKNKHIHLYLVDQNKHLKVNSILQSTENNELTHIHIPSSLL